MVGILVVDIAEHIFELPGNGWPDDPRLKRIGEYFHLDLYDGARGIGWQLFRSLGYTAQEIGDIVLQFRRDVGKKSIKVFYQV